MRLINVVGRQEAMALPPPVQVKLMNDGDQGRTEEQKNGKDDVAVDIRRGIVVGHLAHSEGGVAGVHIVREAPILISPGVELMTAVPVADKTVDKVALIMVNARAETGDTMGQDRNTIGGQSVVGSARLQTVDQEEAGESELRRHRQSSETMEKMYRSDLHTRSFFQVGLGAITQASPKARSDIQSEP
jgi:hypothetical protein